MRIALIGYGKMGKMIETLAHAKGHEIVLRITTSNRNEFTPENIRKADAVIEFTSPAAAFENVKNCLAAGVPTVCGSTGWNDRVEEAKKLALSYNTAFLHASNFSLGVNIFFEINRLLAQLMEPQQHYDVSIHEIHHTQKKDAPSGTAVTLAEQIIELNKRKTAWTKDPPQEINTIQITSERKDPAPGTHHIKWFSGVDDIEIIHHAKSREGFAAGALAAAEFIKGRKGIYEMKDVLNLQK